MFAIAINVRKACWEDGYKPFTLLGWQRAQHGSVEPPAELWTSIAIEEAVRAFLPPNAVLNGDKRHRASLARWRAWKRLLDMPENFTIAGVARVSGWDHTTILYGLKRLKGLTAAEAKLPRLAIASVL